MNTMTVQVMEKGGMYRATYSGITDIRKSYTANKVYMYRNATKHDKVACSGVENDGICYDVFDGERIGGWVGESVIVIIKIFNLGLDFYLKQAYNKIKKE